MSRRIPSFLVVLSVLGSPVAARGAEPQDGDASRSTLTPDEALRIAVRHNPTFRSAVLSERQAAVTRQAETGRYPYIWQVDGGYTRNVSPSLAADGSVTNTRAQSYAVGTELRRTFPLGTSAGVRLQGERFSISRESAALGSDSSGAGYEMSSRAFVTQPLLRGAGRRVNELELRVARVNQVFAGKTKDRVASEMVRDLLLTYWDLWYTSRAVQIERGALALASQQYREAEIRRQQGSLSPVAVLPFETRIAQLQESVVAARSAELRVALALTQLMGATGQTLPKAGGSPPAGGAPGREAIERRLTARSPELAESRQRLKLARMRSEVAGDAYRPRLDLDGWLEARGIGESALGPTRQVAGLNAVSAHIGLTYEMPLTGNRRSATRAEALLAVRIAESDFRATRLRLRTAAMTLVATMDAARAQLAAAEKTLEVALRQHQAEKESFRLGASTPLQIREAEDAVRQARLRVASARVARAQAKISLDHSTGELLRQYQRHWTKR